MSMRFINGSDFAEMVFSGGRLLQQQVQRVNALNVFPVPDGDTGTNMNLTMASGMEALRRKPSSLIGHGADALSKGLLMGARGNSGVILSQLFRGFAKSAAGLEKMNAEQFAAALRQSVDTAYQAVVKPVEGTILTVAREAAKHALAMSRKTSDIEEILREVLAKAKRALEQTPDQLPILKQAGVVDAGGQGLVYLYEGFVQSFRREERPDEAPVLTDEGRPGHGSASAQAQLSIEEIKHGYCTEFLLRLQPGKGFDEKRFRSELTHFGDSLMVVVDDHLVKVHIHAEYPGSVMNHAMNYGDLDRIKIENMREQHSQIVGRKAEEQPAAAESGELGQVAAVQAASKPFGLIAVAAGEGIHEIFSSLGVDVVLSGGQTMNPSTEDILRAVDSIGAECVIVLPNNPNIVLAAQQAKTMANKPVEVVASNTIPQGMAAVLAFREQDGVERNLEAMRRAMGQVKSGQVTFAVRDSQIEGLDIRQGDYLGLAEQRVAAADSDLLTVCKRLLDEMMDGGEEVVTVLSGREAAEESTDRLSEYIREKYPDAELEIRAGGQPLYYYIFSAE